MGTQITSDQMEQKCRRAKGIHQRGLFLGIQNYVKCMAWIPMGTKIKHPLIWLQERQAYCFKQILCLGEFDAAQV